MMNREFILKLLVLLSLVSFLVGSIAYAQNNNQQWLSNFGGSNNDDFRSVVNTSDGGFVAVGSSRSFNTGDWIGISGKGYDDAVIVKYDADCNIQWKKNFGGGYSECFSSVISTDDGFVAVGYSDVNGTGDWIGVSSNGYYDAIIVKYDTQGNVLWKKNFGGYSFEYFESVISAQDGGFVAVGYSVSGSFGLGDAIIVKYDSKGNLLWKKNFGGNDPDHFNSITSAPDGGFVVVGDSASNSFTTGDWTGISGKGYDDAVIVKYDTQGNVLWKKNFGGNQNDYFKSLISTVDGGFVVVGYSVVNGTGDWTGIIAKDADSMDSIVIKYDADGNVLWKKFFGGSEFDYFNAVANAPEGGFIAVGVSNVNGTGDWKGISSNGGYYDATIVKYDVQGNVLWKKNFGGSDCDEFNYVTTVSDGGAVAVGYSYRDSFGNGDWTGISGKGSIDAIVRYEAIECLSMIPTSAGINVGSSLQLTAVFFPSNTKENVIWSSSDNNVATVDSNGLVTAVSLGNAAITVSTIDGIKTAICSITVGLPVIGISVDPTSAAIILGYKQQLTAAVYPADATNKDVLWTSSNPAVAEVDYKGLVIARTVGYAEITARTVEGDFIAISKITVISIPVSGVSVYPTSASIFNGSTKLLRATVYPFNATNKKVTWSSSNNTVAEVDGGNVWAKSIGNAEITVRTLDGDYTAVSKITVVPKPVTSITISPVFASLNIGESKLLTTTISPADAENKNIKWSSTNASVAAVDSSGIVTAIFPGNADIIAATEDGNKTAICKITVLQDFIQWLRNFGGSGSDYFNSVTAAPDGCFVAVGYSNYIGYGDWTGFNGKGFIDAIIVKYNSQGNVLWKQNFGGSGTDKFYSVTTAPDGGFVAVGYSVVNGTGDWLGVSSKGGMLDAIIVKYDSQGNLLWKKNFGGNDMDYFNSVTTASDGEFVAVGYSNPNSFDTGDWTGIGGKGSSDATIVRFDSNGNLLWEKNFGGNDQDQFNSVTPASDGGFVAVGYSDYNSINTGDWTGISGNGNNAIIVKYDSDGNVLWKNFGYSSNSITTASDGGLVAVGGSNIVKYNSQGILIWSESFSAILYSITPASDGGFVAVGGSDSFGTGDWLGISSKGTRDAIIVKFDSQCNLLWNKNFGGSEFDYFASVISTVDGGYVAVGESSPGSFGTGNWFGISGKGYNDAIIVKMSETSVYGRINLQSYNGNKLGIAGTVDISDSVTGNVIESHPITLDAYGNYSVTTSLLGNYIGTTKCSHWLSQSKPISLNVGDNNIDFSLINGDCNNDNQVDESDLGILGDSWYLSAGELNYNKQADLNGDGAVDEIDLTILSDSWYKIGE